MANQPPTSPENRRKTAEANLARGDAFRFKPGQSGNPGGRPRTAKLSEASRAKLASVIPGDPEGRTYAEGIADKLALLAIKGDIRAAQELADRAEGRPNQMAPPSEQHGVKVIIVDVPRPKYDVPDLRPGDDPKKILDVIEKAQSNGHKTQE